MFDLSLLVFYALLFLGMWMIYTGWQSFAGQFDIPSNSLLRAVLKQVSPGTDQAVGRAFAKLAALGWLMLGVCLVVLAIMSLWRSF